MQIPSTMPEQVSLAKELEISYRTLHPTAVLYNTESDTSIRIPFSSITNKYKDFLSTVVVSIALTPEEQEQYMFKPKALSVVLYDTTEFWNDLLILNNALSVIDFKPKMVKIYDPKRLKKVLNEIIMLENAYA